MIVGILGPGGCGGTFLDWTLQYLSGQTHTWHIFCDYRTEQSRIIDQECVPLVDNPIQGRTAHGHKKTHPDDLCIDPVIECFKQHTEFALNSFYFVDQFKSGKTQTEYNQLIAAHHDIKFITYKFTEADIDTVFCFQYEKTSVEKSNIDKKLMPHSGVPFGQLPIWDQRELLSLYYPLSIRGQILSETIAPYTNNFCLDFKVAIECVDVVINDLFQYLGISICKERWWQWKKIYNDWKTKNHTQFFKDLDLIIESIIYGNSFDLSKYNMSFAEETVIASNLLYKHNFGLKSYNKENLSRNTQQWTEILETNIYHDLTKK